MEFRDSPPAVFEANVPHSARIWNYWLGGKDHCPIDRHIGDEVAQMLPSIVAQARADRLFLARAVRYLVSEEGVRQFLDIGTGIPSADNTHEVAQSVAPESRIVYVDNDPIVLAHARALLTSTPQGKCDYIDADLRDPAAILAAAATTLDFCEPIALMLLGILHHLPDEDAPRAIVAHLLAALPRGSFLVVNHATNAVFGDQSDRAVRRWNQIGTPPITLRSPQQIERFFDGLELVAPGVVSCSRWRVEHNPWGEPDEVDEFCGIGRKP